MGIYVEINIAELVLTTAMNTLVEHMSFSGAHGQSELIVKSRKWPPICQVIKTVYLKHTGVNMC